MMINMGADFNVQQLLGKIKDILDKGESVKMKNKDKFKFTLIDTRNILNEHSEYFGKIKNDLDYSKIMNELYQTIIDVESKLNKLSLVKFCRGKAEKYLAQVTEKLYNINLVLISLIGKSKETPQNNNFLLEIENLNKKIKEMEKNMNKKEIIIQKVPDNEKVLKTEEVLCLEGISAYLGLDGRVDFKKAYETLLEASNMGNTGAKILLARMHEKGEYVDKSYAKAFEYCREASQKGNSIGSYMIANYLENELYDEIKEYANYSESALEFYKKSATQGNSDAYTKLGIIYENGLLGELIDHKKALDYYKKAIEIDENPEALNCIGSIYYKGYVLKQNYSLAVESFSQAAKFGNIDAINNLGLCYEYGKGIEKNLEKAMINYKQASEKFHPMALTNQAILLIKLNTNQNKKDFKEAFRLLQLTIHLENKNKDAHYYLGYLYENGFGVINNPYLAYVSYNKSMKLGHIKAKTKVALVLFNGLEGIVTRDEPIAIKLLTEASNADEPEALNYLGLIHEKGSRTVPQSYVKCVDYFKRSQMLGYENAAINLALLKKNHSLNENDDNNFDQIEKLSKKGNLIAKSVLGIINQDNSDLSKTIKLTNRDMTKIKNDDSYDDI